MSTTPVFGWRYQSLGDAPHGPHLGEYLASDVEATLHDGTDDLVVGSLTTSGDAQVGDDLTVVGDIAAGNIIKGTYTPLLSATTATPVLGADGFKVGKWSRVGLNFTVHFDFYIAGSGSNIQGTSWRLGLPYLADLSYHSSGVLDGVSDCIGNWQSRSSTAGQALTGAIVLSGPSGSDGAGTYMIFYYAGSNSSVGSSLFTTTARIKGTARFVADPALTVVV